MRERFDTMRLMRVCVTARPALGSPGSERARSGRPIGVRPAGELAPELALPWIIKLRYGMASGLGLLVLASRYAGESGVALALLGIPIVLMLGSNAALSQARWALTDSRTVLGALFAVDTACLTFILAMMGGPTNPFTLLYLVQITLSAVVLNRVWTWFIGFLSTFGFALLFWFHRPFPLMDPADHGHMHAAHLQGMFAAFAIAAVLISFFIGKVSEILRKTEQEVLALKDRAAKNDRLASLVTLAAGAAHELATPMATIAVVAKELEHRAAGSSTSDQDLLDDARLVRSEVERCRLILQRMSARDTETAVEPPEQFDARELVQITIGEFSGADQGRIDVAVPPEPIPIRVPREATRRALVSLVRNALQADVNGRVLVQSEFVGGGVRFTIQDQGPGMSAEVLNRIAEPFFTTKEPGRGMGLGTFLARMLAERLGGVLLFDSEPGAGTRAILELPVAEKGMAAIAQRR